MQLSPKGFPGAPDIPAIAERRPSFGATAWQALAAPAVCGNLMTAGLAPLGATSDQFSRFIESEINKWTKIARDVGATAD